MKMHRPATAFGAAFFVALLGGVGVLADQSEQLSGIVRSLDVDGRKIVVAPTDRDSTVEVVVDDSTVIETPGGKAIAFKDLKPGDGLGIAHASGVARKIHVAVKPDGLAGHVKSVADNNRTIVVTEVGTSNDVTVAVTPSTSIVSTAGKKLDVKDLKKGDGVGISHLNSVASKVLVNPKQGG